MYLQEERKTLYTESAFAPPPLTAHVNESGNVPPETTDEAMNDDTEDPGPFQQRSDPAVKPENAVAESMDGTMDHNTTTTTTPAPHIGAPRPANWTQTPRTQKCHWKQRNKARQQR